MGSPSPKSSYPARIGFDLTEPQRSWVIAAALRLGLAVHARADERGFVVVVPTPEDALALGRASKRRDDAPAPRRCPRCGSYAWIYKGDRQLCADCGRE